MRIAFYAPLKSPNHPVPSGDRLMARMLMAALQRARTRGRDRLGTAQLSRQARQPARMTRPQQAAQAEIARIVRAVVARGAPGSVVLLSPLLQGAGLASGRASRSGSALPYVTVEASYSERRDDRRLGGEPGAGRRGRPAGGGQHLPAGRRTATGCRRSRRDARFEMLDRSSTSRPIAASSRKPPIRAASSRWR